MSGYSIGKFRSVIGVDIVLKGWLSFHQSSHFKLFLQVHGVIHDKNGKRVATISGKWDESLHYSMGDSSSEDVGQDSESKSHLLWKRSKPSNYQTKYNFTRFAITLNELYPELKVKGYYNR